MRLRVALPFGHGKISAEIADERILAIAQNDLDLKEPTASADALVAQALQKPIGSPPLYELAKGKQRVVLLASDHTRPVPSKAIVPQMLQQIRRGNPNAEITILIATGCHRGTTHEELIRKFGPEICRCERIEIHDCQKSPMVDLGILPSGAPLRVNALAAQADLLVAEGFIEPHFFAGFSGGRKSVLPGVCSTETVFANHSASLIDSEYAHSGSLERNPVHRDMVEGARRAGLRFIVNAVINGAHETVAVFAGDMEKAHRAGADYVSKLSRIEVQDPAGIVITGNGGYPLDQNIYQAIKGMTAAEATLPDSGIIIMIAGCRDGHGGVGFYHNIADVKNPEEFEQKAIHTPRLETVPDQWTSQIFARILAHHKVIMVSDLVDPKLVKDMHMELASNVDEALAMAFKIKGNDAKVAVIPDGLGVVVNI